MTGAEGLNHALLSVSALTIELELLGTVFFIGAASPSLSLTIERRVLADFALETNSTALSDPAVVAASAKWVRWIQLMETLPALLMIPVLAQLSHRFKHHRLIQATPREAMLAVQLLVQTLTPIGFLLEGIFRLPRYTHILFRLLGSLGGGTIAMLLTVFAIRADTCTDKERAQVFLRIELALYSGTAFGAACVGSILGDTTDVARSLERQQWGFIFITLCLLLAAGAQAAYVRYAPRLKKQLMADEAEEEHNAAIASMQLRRQSSLGAYRIQDPESAALRLRGILGSLCSHGRYAGGLFAIFFVAAFTALAFSSIVSFYLTLIGWTAERVLDLSAFNMALDAMHLLAAPLAMPTAGGPEGLIVWTLLLSAVGFFAWAFAPFFSPDYYFLFGIGTSASKAVFPVIRALVSRLVTPSQVWATLAVVGFTEQAIMTMGRFALLSLFANTIDLMPTCTFLVMFSLVLGCAGLATMMPSHHKGDMDITSARRRSAAPLM